MTDEHILRIARVFLRCALGIAFLVAIADRFGWLAPALACLTRAKYLHKRFQGFEVGGWSVRNVTTLSSRLGILLAVVLLAAGGTISAAAQSRIEIATVHSPGLEHNLFGDPADQTVAIYLPAAYQTEPQKRFATIYFLHGYADTPAKGVAEIVQQHMDKLLATQTIEPMIVVAPNGLNRLLGSFYVNSQVMGNWEDYVARDVVAYVDSHYRTLPRPESRGISGHSMGGYGALMLGFKHPDVFSFIYAMSPCCTILEGDLAPGSPVWTRREQVRTVDELPGLLDRELLAAATIAMSAAFAPDKNIPPFYGKSPFVRRGKRVVPDPETLSSFQANIVTSALPGLLPKISKLKSIYIDYGAEDEYTHIPVGAQALSSALSAAGVPHTFEVYEGSHGSRVVEQFEKRLLPWFSSLLRHESVKQDAGY